MSAYLFVFSNPHTNQRNQLCIVHLTRTCFNIFPRRLSRVFRCVSCKSFEMEPLLNLSVNGRSEKFSNSRLGATLNCVFCSSRKDIAGPIWNGALHCPEFIESVQGTVGDLEFLGTKDRILGMLAVCREEHSSPLFMSLNEVAHLMKISCPPLLTVKYVSLHEFLCQIFRSAYFNAGYSCSISHTNPRAIKSDAPLTFFWSVLKNWVLSRFPWTC